MDEFIKLGGYLVEGQPEVSHDNTLSGNGLPESPLGVVGGAGKTYTGVAPIVVDNVEDKISADVAILTAAAPLYIESSTVGDYIYNTINYSGLRFSNVLGGADLSNATASITLERANLPTTTDWHKLQIGNVSGNTGAFALIPADINSGFVWSIGNGGFTTKTVRESKIYNYSFTTAGAGIVADLTSNGYVESHLTTPYNYYGPSQYTATLDGQNFYLSSGIYCDLCWQDVEGTSKWCVKNSGYYSI